MRIIEYKVSYENMISRLPGLFAYLGSNDVGEFILHSSIDSSNGCYGKIVENMRIPNGVNLTIDGIQLLSGGKTYTFRTIISHYYRYKDVLEENNQISFRDFIERGIGKISVSKNITDKYVAAPKFVYLSNVRNIYNELVKMHKQCEFYNSHKEEYGEDKHLCCLCEKYANMGGDDFKNFIENLIPMAEEIAEEYLNYAKNADRSMRLEFDIDLVCSFEDLGLMTPYVPEWIPYKRYYIGDKVYYDGKVWMAEQETTGYYNEDTEKVTFDYNSFKEVGNDLCVMVDPDNTSKCDKMTEGKELEITGSTDSKLRDLRRMVTYLNENNVEETPEDGEDWLFYYRKGIVLNSKTLNDNLGNILDTDGNTAIGIVGIENNKLMAYGDIIEDIKANKDNGTITFVYRLGVHLKSECTEISVDDDGNKLYKWGIYKWDEDEKVGIKYEETYSYEIYGNLANLINGTFGFNNTERITQDDGTVLDVTYRLNGIKGNNHTEHKLTQYEIDNHSYVWIDSNGDLQIAGINGASEGNTIENYTEAFNFDDYINGKYDKILSAYKFEFITYNNSMSHVKLIANQKVNIISILSDFDIYRHDFDEFMDSELMRKDYYNGISYYPTRDIDVHIERGSASAFQQHISFSEIKTLEDMELFQNGSFFKMNDD